MVQDAELGTRFVDRLVRVNGLNGDESWIHIHIEVQGTRQAKLTDYADKMDELPLRLQMPVMG